jgi:hypothetical protein
VQARWFGLFRVRSPLLAESLTCFLFLQVLRWFTSLGCLQPTYGFSGRSSGISLSGLPHSEILGSKPVCGSPKLIAAYHVLHRLLAPRHSPYALSSLTIETRNLRSPLPINRGPLSVGNGLRTTNHEPRHASVPCTLHVCWSASTRLARASARPLWSEKTTVCRIFSCKERRTYFDRRCYVAANLIWRIPGSNR